MFALSLIGVPPFPGFWAKLLVVMGLISQDMAIYSIALAVILVTTVIEANYLFRVVIILYDKTKSEEKSETQTQYDEKLAHGRLDCLPQVCSGPP